MRTCLVLSFVGAVVMLSGCRGEARTPLTRAVAAGDVVTVDRLLEAGADPRARGVSALAWAARTGQIAMVRHLVARGVPTDAPSGVNSWTPLEHALHKGQTDAALALLDLGADVRGPKGRRPLAMAAGYANAPMVAALIARGADPMLDLGGGPSLIALAAAGTWDIDYQFTGCRAHERTVKTLLQRAPRLTINDSIWDRVAYSYLKLRGCRDLIQMIGRHQDKLQSRR